jgi:hypothetical protein
LSDDCEHNNTILKCVGEYFAKILARRNVVDVAKNCLTREMSNQVVVKSPRGIRTIVTPIGNEDFWHSNYPN